MKSENFRQANRRQGELESLETRLQTLYPSVRPRPEYIRNLRQQLDLQMEPSHGSEEKGGWHLMLIAASVLSGTFVIVLAVRGIINFFGGLHPMGSAVETDRIAPVNPVV
jgi:hypothetical protein